MIMGMYHQRNIHCAVCARQRVALHQWLRIITNQKHRKNEKGTVVKIFRENIYIGGLIIFLIHLKSFINHYRAVQGHKQLGERRNNIVTEICGIFSSFIPCPK